MRRADIFLLISGAFYTLERCAGLVSDWYGPDCFFEEHLHVGFPRAGAL